MDPELFILKIPAILIALTIHEFAHGWMALKLGDPTARDAGRLTFNPVAHYDLIGTTMAIFLSFGWAKPVPVNGNNFHKPKRDLFLVSVAGPASNILVAMFFGYFFRIFEAAFPSLAVQQHLSLFVSLVIMLNILLSFFNLLPIPPLDGSKILMSLLPDKWVPGYIEKSRHLPLILLILILMDYYIPNLNLFSKIFYPLYEPYSSFWNGLIMGRFF
ncbi:MAG: site-2 protease family protein [Fibrobacter sp.]|nr:site-2 protease family protein [Fibrobacter sp.]